MRIVPLISLIQNNSNMFLFGPGATISYLVDVLSKVLGNLLVWTFGGHVHPVISGLWKPWIFQPQQNIYTSSCCWKKSFARVDMENLSFLLGVS